MDDTEDLGVLFSGQCFDRDECARLCEEMRVAPRDPSMVGDEKGTYVLRPERRNTSHVSVAPAWKSRVGERLADLKAQFEARFGRRLGELQKPRFLSYSAGQYFLPHRDASVDALQPPVVTSRALSVVVLLNVGDYEGGALVLHDMSVPGSRLEIRGRRGGLVAFHPLVLHEVTTVTRGERYSIAAWFERPPTPSG